MKYKIEVYQSLKQIDSSIWNLGQETLPISMNYEYLEMIETGHKDQIDFFYVVVQKDNTTIGLFSFQLIDFKGEYIKNFFRNEVERGFVTNLFIAGFYKVLDKLSWNLLTAGNIYFTGDAGIHFHSSISSSDRKYLISEAFVLAQKSTNKSVSAFMINNVYDNELPAIHEYMKHSKYATYPVDPDMFMKFNPEWKSFDDYSNSLTSKYRVRMRKVLKESNAIQKQILSPEDIKLNNEKIHDLYMSTAQNVDLNLGYLAKDYFSKMVSIWGDTFKLVGYYLEGKLIGFMSFIIDDKDIDVNYMGLDYNYNNKFKVYNRMLIDLVELGIELNAKSMHLGRTATEMKSTIGAVARPMHIYLRGLNGIMNWLMRFFEPYFGSPVYTLRSPFKNN